MAERNHLRIADHNDVPNDDPFAELTRIMGFDPRRPVRNEQAVQVEPLVETDDFGIDLEKELMGEFAAEEVEAADRGYDHSSHYQDEAPAGQAT
ncbi:MAG: hypothetical protein H0T56_03350, partial [Pseudaminobacter sp.]|nr:hypothetical protein [Pseudaminobacter sp.]